MIPSSLYFDDFTLRVRESNPIKNVITEGGTLRWGILAWIH
jgi:hypothetical protein